MDRHYQKKYCKLLPRATRKPAELYLFEGIDVSVMPILIEYGTKMHV